MAKRPVSGIWEDLAALAGATRGSRAGLDAVLASDRLVRLATESALDVSLALRAADLGVGGAIPEAWKESLRGSAALWMMIDEAAGSVGRRLDQRGLTWIPIKGFDVGTRFYGRREERRITDLDLLVGSDEIDAARATLEELGWTPLEASARTREFVAREGYTYHYSSRDPSHHRSPEPGRRADEGPATVATGPPPTLVELHFRLWGFAPEGLSAAVLARTEREPGLEPAPRRAAAADVYLIAALHAWTRPAPRDLLDWLDLQRVLEERERCGVRAETVDAVVETAERWGVELPVCLSSAVADRLWPDAGHGEIHRGLLPALAPRERPLVSRLRSGGVDAVPLNRLVLARLLSGRPSRAGWRSVWRRLWAHPGIVELETRPEHAWAHRRLTHVKRSLTGGGQSNPEFDGTRRWRAHGKGAW